MGNLLEFHNAKVMAFCVLQTLMQWMDESNFFGRIYLYLKNRMKGWLLNQEIADIKESS
jgi:hypothetical protein